MHGVISLLHATSYDKSIFRHVNHFKSHLTHISLASFYGTSANSADPDQTPRDLHCLLTEFRLKFGKKREKYHPKPPKIVNGLAQLMGVGISIRLKLVGLESVIVAFLVILTCF